jgi:hypothetical protein
MAIKARDASSIGGASIAGFGGNEAHDFGFFSYPFSFLIVLTVLSFRTEDAGFVGIST